MDDETAEREESDSQHEQGSRWPDPLKHPCDTKTERQYSMKAETRSRREQNAVHRPFRNHQDPVEHEQHAQNSAYNLHSFLLHNVEDP
jgi:hypothetical protein